MLAHACTFLMMHCTAQFIIPVRTVVYSPVQSLQCQGKSQHFNANFNLEVLLIFLDKQLVSTNGSEVVCIPPIDTTHLAPCNHEEGDTRMILHLADAVKVFKRFYCAQSTVMWYFVCGSCSQDKCKGAVDSIWNQQTFQVHCCS